MRPTKFLALSALFYLILLAVFGDTQKNHEHPQPTVAPRAEILYSPLAAPSTTLLESSSTSTTSTTTTTPVVALVGPDTPCQEWVPEALKAGWPADRVIIETLLSVMYRESRCIPQIVSVSDDHGLLQINQIHRDYVEQIFGIPFEEAMADPVKNLHFAWKLYSELEDAGRCGWRPWSLECR